MVKSYEQFLTEQRIPPEIEEKFGQILFGDHRGLNERDTEHEADVFGTLIGFLAGWIDKDLERYLTELLQLKKCYPDVLEPDKYRYVYRGLVLSSKRHLERKEVQKRLEMFRKNAARVSINENKYWTTLPKKINYRAASGVQSWTTKHEIAQLFSDELISKSDEDKESEVPFEQRTNFQIPYILVAKPPRQEMLFNTDFFNSLDPESYLNEYEIIRVSRKSIKCQVQIPTWAVKQLLL